MCHDDLANLPSCFERSSDCETQLTVMLSGCSKCPGICCQVLDIGSSAVANITNCSFQILEKLAGTVSEQAFHVFIPNVYMTCTYCIQTGLWEFWLWRYVHACVLKGKAHECWSWDYRLVYLLPMLEKKLCNCWWWPAHADPSKNSKLVTGMAYAGDGHNHWLFAIPHKVALCIDCIKLCSSV